MLGQGCGLGNPSGIYLGSLHLITNLNWITATGCSQTKELTPGIHKSRHATSPSRISLILSSSYLSFISFLETIQSLNTSSWKSCPLGIISKIHTHIYIAHRLHVVLYFQFIPQFQYLWYLFRKECVFYPVSCALGDSESCCSFRAACWASCLCKTKVYEVQNLLQHVLCLIENVCTLIWRRQCWCKCVVPLKRHTTGDIFPHVHASCRLVCSREIFGKPCHLLLMQMRWNYIELFNLEHSVIGVYFH